MQYAGEVINNQESNMQQKEKIAEVAARSSLTTDQLSLAAFLVSRGHEPTLTVTPTRRILFNFAAAMELAAEVATFHDGSAVVSPSAFDAARIRLRRQMDVLLGSER